MRARSGRSGLFALTPQYMLPARKPCGAVTPPEISLRDISDSDLKEGSRWIPRAPNKQSKSFTRGRERIKQFTCDSPSWRSIPFLKESLCVRDVQVAEVESVGVGPPSGNMNLFCNAFGCRACVVLHRTNSEVCAKDHH